MIDIHTHILPGIDDGSAELGHSLQMAEAAVKEGIHTLIATPHHANGKYTNAAKDVAQRVKQLNQALTGRGIPLTVLAGQEIRINRELLEELHAGTSASLHQTRYVLIELPSGHVPSYTEDTLHELRVLGLVPVIAHPERNAELSASPARLVQLIEAGALSQLTSHSVNGAFGSKLQKLCLEWCKGGLVHFISSDAHNLTHRAFGLDQAYSMVKEKLSSELVDYYQDNARKLVQDHAINPEPITWKSKSWWRLWA